LRLRKIKPKDMIPYFDALAFVFPQAWIFGRMHCAWVHDHPGIQTNSWLGVQFPGKTRYDLGVVEVLYLAAVIVLFYWLDRKPRPPGFYLPAFLIPYGLFRLWLDTLHVDVMRYGGLSVDQWSSLAAIAAGIGFARWNRWFVH
jgi:phosphatidylglycerol:prolipoprotein diacylglycerol transferase